MTDDEKTELLSEVLNTQQRMKLKQVMRRNKAKIKLGRERAKRKTATPEKLKSRAEKQARTIFLKKIVKNKDKSDLSMAQRATIEKQLAKKKGAIKRLAKKLLPKVRKADREKMRHNTAGKSQ